MRLPQKFVWKICFLVYAFFTATNVIYFFEPESPSILYYHIMMAWDSWFVIFYILNIAAILLSVLALVPFWGFLYDRFLLSRRFWIYFFWARLFLEFHGRAFEVTFIKSLYISQPMTTWLTILTLLTINIPIYLALWFYIRGFARRT